MQRPPTDSPSAARFLVRLALLLLLAWPAEALGQRSAASFFQGGLGFGVTALDDDRAAALPTGSGYGVHLDFAPHLFDVAALRAEAGLTFLEPLCFNEDADCPEREAHFLMLSGSLAAGMVPPGFHLGDGLRLAPGLYAGYERVEGWRGARNCVNCGDEDLALRGGLYAEPTLVLSVSAGYGFSVAYRAYHPRSDLRSRVTVRFFSRSR